MASDILNIDLASQAFMRDPFPTLARLRQAGPVVRIRLPFLGPTWAASCSAIALKAYASRRKPGLLRCARNDGVHGSSDTPATFVIARREAPKQSRALRGLWIASLCSQ